MFCMDLRKNSNFSLYNINSLVFITKAESVYCAVCTKSLHNTDTFHLYRVKILIISRLNQSYPVICLQFSICSDIKLRTTYMGNFKLQPTSSCSKYKAYSESKYRFAVKKNLFSFHTKFYCYQILHSSNYFSTYSPPLLRHLS